MDHVQENFERDAVVLTTEILRDYAEALAGVGLRSRFPRTERSQGSSGDQAEIRVYFDDENGVFDVIEFFVIRSGRINASLEEMRAWLGDTVRDVIRRRRTLGPKSVR
jgi:hypothetical protein